MSEADAAERGGEIRHTLGRACIDDAEQHRTARDHDLLCGNARDERHGDLPKAKTDGRKERHEPFADACPEALRRIGDKNKALILLGIFFAIGFISLGALTIMSGNFLYLAGFLTLPYIIWLFKELRQFNSDKTVIPRINKLNFPLDNWEQVVKDGAESFYFRLLLSRNIMMYMALILICAIAFGV